DFEIAELERPFVIGRTAPADFVVADPDASRRHVEILRRGAQVQLRELGSKNGTELSGRPIEGGKVVVWPRGASIRIGKNELNYQDPVTEALAELERAEDELMRDDESLTPPDVQESPDLERGSPESPAQKGKEERAPPQGPVVAVPE